MGVFAKVRNLGKYGIISDIDPYDLPPEAFSAGVNVRFRNGRVSRAPIWRDVAILVGGSNPPRYSLSATFSSGSDLLFVCYLDGSCALTSSVSQTAVDPVSYTTSSNEALYSDCLLENVVYLNRTDRTPWYFTASASQFSFMPNWGVLVGGTQTWTCGLLRSCGGALVALNMTINGTNYPQMLITSSFPQANSAPTSWDYTSPSTGATQNTLEDLEGSINDACRLGNNLCIYGFDQTWLMSPTTAFEEFDYVRLPFRKGAINANCSVEIDGKNYVFGPDDIWMHDGVAERSIVAGRNRDFIYSSLNFAETNRCFVKHNPALKEIYFCYVSGDRLTRFASLYANGCNRCATYDYLNDVWTFDDLPSVFGGAYVNLNVANTWSSITSTWTTVGGSWQGQDQNLQRTVTFVGEANANLGTNATLYSFDLYGSGASSSFPLNTTATSVAHLERDGMDLDQLGVDLPDYKLISSLYPLGRLDVNATSPLLFTFGTSDYYGQPATFDGTVQTYDGLTNYKLDYNMAGRYATMYIDFSDFTTFSLSGFDFLVDETGQR